MANKDKEITLAWIFFSKTGIELKRELKNKLFCIYQAIAHPSDFNIDIGSQQLESVECVDV